MRFVADECGISLTAYHQIESGKSVPSAETLARLADVLGYSMDELWRCAGRIDDLPNPTRRYTSRPTMS